MDAISGMKSVGLLRSKKKISTVICEPEAWEYLGDFAFDVILTNPPFAGEIRDHGILSHYELARKGRGSYGKTENKVERDVLFIERCLRLLKPGGRMAIVLPQGKFNNATLAYIREWILRHARLLAVVGLHPHTFKPHTVTKTSVLFVQKHTEEDQKRISHVEDDVRLSCPNYSTLLKKLIDAAPERNLTEEDLPTEVAELLHEWFDVEQANSDAEPNGTGSQDEVSEPDLEALENERAEWDKAVQNLETALRQAKESKDREKQTKLKAQLREAEKKLARRLSWLCARL